MNNSLKVLVIDDSLLHRLSAGVFLKDNNITVVDSYFEGAKILLRECDFDVVLVDLLMPASSYAQGPDGQKYIGQEMPVGIFLALMAAKAGAKYVAVFTDSDHHAHPASACFDHFNKNEDNPTPLLVNGAKLWLTNNRSWMEKFGGGWDDPKWLLELSEEDRSKALAMYDEAAGKSCWKWSGAKNWQKLLNYMLA